MDKQLKSVFVFESYKVNNIDFSINEKFNNPEPLEIEFSVEVEVGLHESLPKGKVTLISKLFQDAEINDYPFSLTVSLSGYFAIEDPTMSKEQLYNFCELNGTAALFPFLRSIIADITKVANTEPLILPLINIHNLIKKQKELV